jgi:hypothetical protein
LPFAADIVITAAKGKPGNTRSEIRTFHLTIINGVPDFRFRILRFFDNPPPFAVYYASPGPPGGSTYVFGVS